MALRKNKSILLLFLSIIAFSSCTPDIEEVVVLEISHSSTSDFLKMCSNEGKLTVVGGQAWEKGEIWELNNQEFKIRYSAPVSYRNVRYDNRRKAIIAVGMNGIFTIISDTIQEINHREGVVTRDILPTSEYDIIVGGKSNKLGYLIGINSKVGYEPETRLDHEIRSITQLDTTIIAAGFGIVLKSEDNGISWEILSPEGDFYVAVQSQASDLYVVGQEGQLSISKDFGNNWEKIDVPLNQKINYGRIINGQLHLLCEEGILQSLDLIDRSWSLMKIGNADLYDIALYNNDLYVCGEDGYLARILE